MNIGLTQCYVEVGVRYPFTHIFQRFVSERLTSCVQPLNPQFGLFDSSEERDSALVHPASSFNTRYGEQFDLTLFMSARAALKNVEVRGPTVSRKYRVVEYGIFLPFERPPSGYFTDDRELVKPLTTLFQGVVTILRSLDLDASVVITNSSQWIEEILASPETIDRETFRGSKPNFLNPNSGDNGGKQ
jgi:hypothetical protein